MRGFFRYPGGKGKISCHIVRRLDQLLEKNYQYREPFFGGGSIGLQIINNPNIKNIWINDRDIGIAYLWTAVIQHPEELKERILDFKPTVDSFFQFRNELINNHSEDVIDFAFKKLAIQQISYSGLGVKSGGPLGGVKQKSNYKIDCRWSPSYICGKIDFLHRKFKEKTIHRESCTSFDFVNLIEDETFRSLLYLDPPYYVKGNELYQYGFSEDDHARLSDVLKKTKHAWLLSYDDCPQIRELYKWATIETLDVTYNITAQKDKSGKSFSRKKGELIITSSS
jgi:DNA adenine methylase